MTVTVQQIRYTTEPLAWHALAQALGLVALPGGGDDWAEFAGSGILAIHRVASPDLARSEISLLTDELDEIAAVLGDDVRLESLDDVGRILVVDGPPALTVAPLPSVTAPVDSPLSVLPIWYDADLEAPGRLLDALTLRRRLASDSGGWVDFTAAGGGMIGLHRSTERSGVEASFEYAGPLEALAARLSDAGYDPRIVDESYNRTLLVTTPEGSDLWVNGAQDDMYGYTRSN